MATRHDGHIFIALCVILFIFTPLLHHAYASSPNKPSSTYYQHKHTYSQKYKNWSEVANWKYINSPSPSPWPTSSTPTQLHDKVDPFLKRHANEKLEAWLFRINNYVHNMTGHCNTTETFLGPKDRSDTADSGILVWGAVSCGLCSQRAYWLASLLLSNRQQVQLLGLSGHVVATVKDGESRNHWILDPDFGTPPFLADITSPSSMKSSATKQYKFLLHTKYADNYKEIIEYYSTIDDNKLIDMRYLKWREMNQARWLNRLKPTLQQDSLQGTMYTTGLVEPKNRIAHAKAVHALLVAAERKYGSYGYRSLVISITPLDFIDLKPMSAAPFRQGIRQFRLTNFGYLPAQLALRKTEDGTCTAEDRSGMEGIQIAAHSSVLLSVDSSCIPSPHPPGP